MVDLYHINTPMCFGYEKFTFLNHFLIFFTKCDSELQKQKTGHNFCSNSPNTLIFCMIIEYIPKNLCGKNFQKKMHNGGLNCENSFLGVVRANSSTSTWFSQHNVP